MKQTVTYYFITCGKMVSSPPRYCFIPPQSLAKFASTRRIAVEPILQLPDKFLFQR